MKCPKCKSAELKEGAVKDRDVRIDYCPRCKGIWFDAGELEHVSDAAIRELAVARDAAQTSSVCPRCAQLMYGFNYPQTLVEIEFCGKCKGLWLDRGELKEIEAVRRDLDRGGEIKTVDDVPGVKGVFLRWIDSAIGSLSDF